MSTAAVITHAVIAVAFVAAYAVVTVTGHDGNSLLLLLGGQGIGGMVQTATSKAGASGT